MQLRETARWLRDQTIVGDAFRTPWRALRGLGVRLPRRLYQHLGSRGVFEVQVPGGGHFRWKSDGHVIENCVYWDGIYAYEGESIGPWLALAKDAKVVLDIGANTGLFALSAAASGAGKVYAFEPVPRIAATLRGNAGLNPNLSITIVEKAVGATTGTAMIHDPGGANCYSASLNSEFLAADKQAYPVAVVRIDDFVKEQGLAQVDLIKLDVEGFEDAALEGMQATMRDLKPALMLEVLKKASDRLLEQVRGLVHQGYGYYLLDGDGLTRSDQVERPRHGRNVLLCLPSKLPSSLVQRTRSVGSAHA